MNSATSQPELKDAFSADWLSLREPFDEQARHQAARSLRLGSHLKRLTQGLERPLRVIDLGCGTGSNLRWLAPHLPCAQQWLVVDHDEALLKAWPDRFSRTGTPLQGDASRLGQVVCWPLAGRPVQIVRRQLDLATGLPELPWQASDLVTASALIDLVSKAWLEQLVACVSAARATLFLTLSVDGRHHWHPVDADDEVVGKAFAAHQRRDKGFGPALGAQAVPVLEAALGRAGYAVSTARSDWQVNAADGPGAAALYRAMVQGMGDAARDQDPDLGRRVLAWQARRVPGTTEGRLTVGHQDLLAWPADSRKSRRLAG